MKRKINPKVRKEVKELLKKRNVKNLINIGEIIFLYKRDN